MEMKLLIFVTAYCLAACASKPSQANPALENMRLEREVRNLKQANELKQLRHVGEKEQKVADAKQAAARLELFKQMGVDPDAPIRGGGSLGMEMAPRESLTESFRADSMLKAAQQHVIAIEAQTRVIESAAWNARSYR